MKKNLSDDIQELQDSISSINTATNSLNNQIAPFLELAIIKYPNLSENDALMKLHYDIADIQTTTRGLEIKEQEIKETELKLEKLKRTPPDVDFELAMDKKDLIILTTFNNEVPIKIQPSLPWLGSWECDTKKIHDIFRKAYIMGLITIYPPKDKNQKYRFVYDSIEENESLPNDKLLGIRMIIKYSSNYTDEIQQENLSEKEIELDYFIEPYNRKFSKTKFNTK